MASKFGKQKFDILAFISPIVKLIKPIHEKLMLETRPSANMKGWQQLIYIIIILKLVIKKNIIINEVFSCPTNAFNTINFIYVS